MWLSDQVVDRQGVKQYYVERSGIDYDDIVQGWTSYNYKHVRQIFPLLQSDPLVYIEPNTYTFDIGWANPCTTLNKSSVDNNIRRKLDPFYLLEVLQCTNQIPTLRTTGNHGSIHD